MKNKLLHTDLQSTVSYLLKKVESEVPVYFDGSEEHLFSTFLKIIGFSSLQDFLVDVELFLKEEIDFETISHANVSDLNFNILASKFGKKYGLRSLVKTVGVKEIVEFQLLGWRATRIILVTIIKPELRSLSFGDAQRLVITLHDFIDSYSIIQGVKPNAVLDELQFWDAFAEYKFTLELDNDVPKQLPKDEFIAWAHPKVSFSKCGEVLEHNKLIKDSKQWANFFSDHTTSIEVVEGKLQRLIAVLYQMEQKQFFHRNKGKGCWTIWQMKLVSKNGEAFSRELRKLSSKINNESTDKDKQIYRFAKELVCSLLENDLK